MSRIALGALVLVLAATPPGSAQGGPARQVVESPVPVSPGQRDEPTTAGSVVPSFSWVGVERAARYELVVFGLDAGTPEAEPEIRVLLPGAATSWTPPLESALRPGEEYAWALRAIYSSGGAGDPAARVGPWSMPHRFQVAAAPPVDELEQALRVLQQHLLQQDLRSGGGAPSAEPGRRAAAAEPATSAGRAGADRQSLASTVVADATGLKAMLGAEGGVVLGVHGVTLSGEAGSAGVVGEATAEGGAAIGVIGRTTSGEGAGGWFENAAGGDILRGVSNGELVFRVEKGGAVQASSFTGNGSGLVNVPVGSHHHDGSYVKLGGDVGLGGDQDLDLSDVLGALDGQFLEPGALDDWAGASRQAYFEADSTFTVPAGVTVLEITAIGGGGAGGFTGSFAGGGGGGSGMVATVPVDVSPGEVLTVTVGWGGSQAGPAADGGPTVVSSFGGAWRVEVAGGKAGQHAETVSQGQGGAGGAGYFGGGGGAGSPAGGGGAGVIAAGGSGDSFSSGAGASGGAGVPNSHFPAPGGGGGPGGGVADVASSNELGGSGTQPGAGGSGGATPGAGHPGAVLIRWVGPPI